MEPVSGKDDHEARIHFALLKSAEEIVDPEQKALYAYWAGLKGDRPAPDYDDFDVVDVQPRVLPHIFLLQYLPDEDDFLHRVVGTAIDEGNGFSASGKKLKSFDAVRRSDLVDTLRKSLFCGGPCFSASRYYGHDPKGEAIHRLAMPLHRDGLPTHLVGVAKIRFFDQSSRRPFGPRSGGF